jgi:SAM-dependent methyltransferase
MMENMRRKLNAVVSCIKFTRDFQQFRALSSFVDKRFRLQWVDRCPCLNDRTSTTGSDKHYIYHPAWAARILAKTKPVLHTDISSTLYFCAIASAFVPIRFYDYRPANLQLSNLSVSSADLTCLPFDEASLDSISCMHVVEHIGLGRYGDPLDPIGDLKAIFELKRVLATNGNLLFVVPVGGNPRVMFNAHRIYSYGQIISYFQDLKLIEFSLIPDDPNKGELVSNCSQSMADACAYGCGCFWFRKC